MDAAISHVRVLLTEVPAVGGEPPDWLWRGLSGEEVLRMQRYRRVQDRWLFAAARALLRHGLATGFGVVAPRFVVDGNGRPHLESRDPDFNFSHTEGLVVCALGAGCEVGVDCERVDRKVDGAAIAERYFAPAERVVLRGMAESAVGFWRVWTLKEAVTKAVGMGLSLPLADFAVALDPVRLVGTCAAVGPVERWRLAECAVGDSHHVAVAVRAAGAVEIGFEEVALGVLDRDGRW